MVAGGGFEPNAYATDLWHMKPASTPNCSIPLVPLPRIELGRIAYETTVLPLNYRGFRPVATGLGGLDLLTTQTTPPISFWPDIISSDRNPVQSRGHRYAVVIALGVTQNCEAISRPKSKCRP